MCLRIRDSGGPLDDKRDIYMHMHMHMCMYMCICMYQWYKAVGYIQMKRLGFTNSSLYTIL